MGDSNSYRLFATANHGQSATTTPVCDHITPRGAKMTGTSHIVASSLMLSIIFVALHYLNLIPPVFAIESLCPGGTNPDPNVVFCDDFEDGTWFNNPAWQNVSEFCCDRNNDGVIPPPPSSETEGVTCGAKGFNSDCTAWSEKADGHYAEQNLPSSNEYYFRWFGYLADPFVLGGIQDKHFRVRSKDKSAFNSNVYCFTVTVMATRYGSFRPSFLDFSGGDVDYFQNQGNDLTLQPGRWYLFELYIKLNTLGKSDGIVKLWIDDASQPIPTQTLRLFYTSLKYRNPQESCPIENFQLTDYHDVTTPAPGQHQRWDQIVVSLKPIGPMGGMPRDTTAPASPKNLRIQ